MSSENWRWNTGRHLRPTNASISVIEPPALDKDDEGSAARLVPFGFSRVLSSDRYQLAAEPLTWEGDHT